MPIWASQMTRPIAVPGLQAKSHHHQRDPFPSSLGASQSLFLLLAQSVTTVRFGPARNEGDRGEGIDRVAILVIGRPLHQNGALRLGPGGLQVDHFAFEGKQIAGSHRQQPAQTVDFKTNQGMGPKRTRLKRKAHGNGSGVPSRRRQAFEHGFLRSIVVEMKRLRIELGGELLDFLFGDLDRPTFETIPKDKSSNHSIIVSPGI